MLDIVNAPKLLTPQDATAYIREAHGFVVAVRTLAKWRWSGEGPKFLKSGARRVLYRPCDIDVWVDARLGQPISSTSETRAA